jgi:hypothetical protein
MPNSVFVFFHPRKSKNGQHIKPWKKAEEKS